MRFEDRADAGRLLAVRLAHLRDSLPVVLGLPRGGVPVAAEIAERLNAQLDIVLVRKVGAPGREELAVGAVGENRITVKNDLVLRELGVSWADVAEQVAIERDEVVRRAVELRSRPRPDLHDRTVIVVDDGIATGATVRAALRVVRRLGAAWVVLAVPVAPPESVRALAQVADEVVCLITPRDFMSVGQWYEDFTQVPDDDVRDLLK